MSYKKLVRDKIPEIIAASGQKPITRILNNDEYLEALITKLGEEYEEFKAERNVEELADIQEVLLALADALDIPHSELAQVYAKKAATRGAFKKRIYLEGVEE